MFAIASSSAARPARQKGLATVAESGQGPQAGSSESVLAIFEIGANFIEIGVTPEMALADAAQDHPGDCCHEECQDRPEVSDQQQEEHHAAYHSAELAHQPN